MTVFIAKNDYMVSKHNEKITNFLSVALASWASLVFKEPGITPKRKEGMFTQLRQVLFGRCNPLRRDDGG
jgi:hypothetical protein